MGVVGVGFECEFEDCYLMVFWGVVEGCYDEVCDMLLVV